MGRGAEVVQLCVYRLRNIHSLGHSDERCAVGIGPVGYVAGCKTYRRRRWIGVHRDGFGETARLARTGVSGNGFSVCSARIAGAVVVGSMNMNALSWDLQLLNT